MKGNISSVELKIWNVKRNVYTCTSPSPSHSLLPVFHHGDIPIFRRTIGPKDQ